MRQHVLTVKEEEGDDIPRDKNDNRNTIEMLKWGDRSAYLSQNRVESRSFT